MTTEPDLSSPGTTSESEEMYLITVARAVEDGSQGPIPVAHVAKELKVSVASANEMVRKLTTRDLLEYEPYRGVSLTPMGARVAERVLRTRRLWATFLAEHLGLTPSDADDQACLLEHVTLPDAVDRLASFLGDPDTGPLGHPIPHGDGGPTTTRTTRRLSELGVGSRFEVVSVDGPKQASSFLAGEGIHAGTNASVAAVGDAGMLVRVAEGLVHIGADLAASIEVRPGG